MFRLVEECDLVRFLITPGTQKEYECPFCGMPITYFSIPSFICSYCFSELPDITCISGDVVARALWHIDKLSSDYEKIDNISFQGKT